MYNTIHPTSDCCLRMALAILLCIGCNNGQKPLMPEMMQSKAEMANTLFAFVGEQVAVQALPHSEGGLDDVYEAKYKIRQRVYGYFEGDTITFTAFGHYGKSAFANYTNALLFVSRSSTGWHHEKY